MIRHRQDSDFLLITQDDHARLSGELARYFGNDHFAAPMPLKQVIDAVAMHDCGWPLHDDNPTLNARGLPLHVFESPIPNSTRVWAESARRASEVDPYTGLLVSLHVLGLSAAVPKRDPTPVEREEHRHELFLRNQFQQDQIELQDQLRQRLGMRTDFPLRLGLAKSNSGDERESLLAFNYNVLKLMDRLSLEVCCSDPLPWKIDAFPPRPGADSLAMQIEHEGEWRIKVAPWPFAIERLEFQISARRLPGNPYGDEQAFQRAYREAPIEVVSVEVSG